MSEPDVAATQSSSSWSMSEALAAWLGAQVLAVLWASLVLTLDSGRTAGEPQQSLWWFLVGGVGLWLAYLALATWLMARRRAPNAPLVKSPPTALAVVVGLVIGVACQLVVVPAVYFVVGPYLDGDPEASARTLVAMVNSTSEHLALIVAVVGLAPVAEELMYRGVLLRGMTPVLGVGGSIVVSSLVFAVAHGELILIPGLLAFALVLGLLARWSQGLAAPIAAHSAFNATTVAILLGG